MDSAIHVCVASGIDFGMDICIGIAMESNMDYDTCSGCIFVRCLDGLGFCLPIPIFSKLLSNPKSADSAAPDPPPQNPHHVIDTKITTLKSASAPKLICSVHVGAHSYNL